MVVTEPQAREMQAAIESFQAKDTQTAQAQRQADLAIALAWFNTQGIQIPAATTRTQSLQNFNDIIVLQRTETDRFRLTILKEKLVEANNKYKAVKKVNPNG